MTEILEKTRQVLALHPREPRVVLAVFQDIQRELNYLPPESVRETAEHLGIPLAKAYSIATFYKALSLEPRGKTVFRVCTGTACHIRGAAQIVDELCRILEIKPGETTPDQRFTIETVNCVGACAMAPLVVANGDYHGAMTPDKARKLVDGGEADEN